MSEVFVSTDARRACPRGVIRWARIPEVQVRIPSRGMGTFSPHAISSIFRLSLTHTHTHTHARTHARTHAHTHTHSEHSSSDTCYCQFQVLTKCDWELTHSATKRFQVHNPGRSSDQSSVC